MPFKALLVLILFLTPANADEGSGLHSHTFLSFVPTWNITSVLKDEGSGLHPHTPASPSVTPAKPGVQLLASAKGNSDGLTQLEVHPSSSASQRLSDLYRKTESPDQRIWIIQTLALRLEEQGDPSALPPLLEAAEDPDPTLRGPALRALMGFRSLPQEEVRAVWYVRLHAAAQSGVKHTHPGVRQGALDLQRVLQVWKKPSGPPPEALRESKAELRRRVWAFFIQALRWLWVLILPLVTMVWGALGFPLFDVEIDEGRRADAAWEVLNRRRSFLAMSLLMWLFLAALLASYGFDILALVLGRPQYEIGGGWITAYFSAGLCAFLPGAFAAGGFSRNPGRFSSTGALTSLPQMLITAGLIFFFLGPLEVLYRLLFRRIRKSRRDSGTLIWILETGCLRAGYLAACVTSGERQGLFPAFERCRKLFGKVPKAGRWPLGLGAFDPRFALLCAAPVLALFCGLVAKGLPVEWRVSGPVVLLGCVLWSWGVLAGILFALLQALEGVDAAARYLWAARRELPEELGPWRAFDEGEDK